MTISKLLDLLYSHIKEISVLKLYRADIPYIHVYLGEHRYDFVPTIDRHQADKSRSLYLLHVHIG